MEHIRLVFYHKVHCLSLFASFLYMLFFSMHGFCNQISPSRQKKGLEKRGPAWACCGIMVLRNVAGLFKRNNYPGRSKGNYRPAKTASLNRSVTGIILR